MKVLDSEEFTYFIDKEGYLLDENGYYLLDEKDKMIKVDRKLIKKLREFKMIEWMPPIHFTAKPKIWTEPQIYKYLNLMAHFP